MKKKLQTFRFLTKSFSSGIIFGLLAILSTVALTDIVYYLTARELAVHKVVSLTVPFEVIAGFFALLLSMALFIVNFRMILANGVSRKTFLLANLPAAIIVAAVYAVFNLTVEKVHGLFWPINSISDLVYENINWASFLIFQLSLYFLLIVFGWVITLAYYRSSVPVKWAISISPLVFLIILQQDNAHFSGDITRAIGDYLHATMGTPYSAALSMLIYGVVFCGLAYLLLRRAPIKD
jgi:hypothetical protein